MTHRVLAFALLTALSAACGPSAPPPDEVTETWTSGDDAPLEENGEPSRE